MLDAALNALSLLLAARLAGERIALRRCACAALAGAAVAEACRQLSLTRGQTALLWLPTALLMVALAHGRRALAHPAGHVALLLSAAGLLGGIVLALSGATGSLAAAYALGGGCALIASAHVRGARRVHAGVWRAQVVCVYRGRRASFDAMIDSGNTLRDYLTHLPVIVLPEAAGRRRLHLGEDMLRPIFADTAGGRQMMGVLAPQAVEIRSPERRRVRAIIALSPGMREDAPALVPAALLEDGDQKRRGNRIWNRRGTDG